MVPRDSGTNIRMVYNDTSIDLNEFLRENQFIPPMMSIQTREVQEVTPISEIDTKEIFLNLIINKDMRKCCGVDIAHLRSYDPELASWEANISIS